MAGICDSINATSGAPAFPPPTPSVAPAASDTDIETDLYWLRIAATLEKFTYIYVKWLVTEVTPAPPTRVGDPKARAALNQPTFKPFFDFLVGVDSPLSQPNKDRLTTLRADPATKPEAFRTFLQEQLNAGATPPKHARASAILEEFTQSYIRALITEIKPDPGAATPRAGYPNAYTALTQPSFKPFFDYLKGATSPLSAQAKAEFVSLVALDRETAAQKTLEKWEAELARRKSPVQVNGVVVGSVSGGQAPINWAVAARAAQYSLITWDEAKRASTCYEEDMGTMVSHTLTGIPANSTRSVAIVAKNDTGYGPVSAPVTITTTEDTPGPVVGLNVKQSRGVLTVSWKRPTTGKDPSKYHIRVYRKSDYAKDTNPRKPGVQTSSSTIAPLYEVIIDDVDGQTNFTTTIRVDDRNEYEVEIFAEGSPFGPPVHENITVPDVTEDEPILFGLNYRLEHTWLQDRPRLKKFLRGITPEAAGFSYVPYARTWLQTDSAVIPSSGDDRGTGGSARLYWSTHEEENPALHLPKGLALQLHGDYLGRWEPVELFAEGTTYGGSAGGTVSMSGDVLPQLISWALGYRGEYRARGTTSEVRYPVYQLRPNYFSDADGTAQRVDIMANPTGFWESRLSRKWLNLILSGNIRLVSEDVDGTPPSLYRDVPDRTPMSTVAYIAKLRLETEWGGIVEDRFRTAIEGYAGLGNTHADNLTPAGNRDIGTIGPTGLTPGQLGIDHDLWGGNLTASVDLHNNRGWGLRYLRSLALSGYHGSESSDQALDTRGEGYSLKLKVGGPDGNVDISYAVARTERMLFEPRIIEDTRTYKLTWNLPATWTSGMPVALDFERSRADLHSEFPNTMNPFGNPVTDERDVTWFFRLSLGLGSPANETLAASHRDNMGINLP